MALFRRTPKVPEWASFMTPDEYRRFVDVVRETLDARGIEHRIGDGMVHAGESSYGLVNLAQLCRGEDDWPAIVADHFDRLLRTAADSPPEDFEAAAPLLRARLVHPEMIEGAPAPVAHRRVADDLVLAVAVDFSESVGYANEDDVARWGRPLDELLELGLRQVREREEPPEEQTLELNDGTVIRARFGDSMYTSTFALWLDDGLVALPHRHAILTHPLDDASAIRAINHLIALGRRMFEEGPSSISDQLYWKRGDELIRLPVVHREDGADFIPPEAFVARLNELA